MRICQEHWAALKSAVESRGLGGLIAANGREAVARTVAELEGKAEADDFDPLMHAHNIIVAKCTDWLGIGLLMGDYCPICEILRDGVFPPIPEGHRYASNASYFIDGPADAALDIAKELGLVA